MTSDSVGRGGRGSIEVGQWEGTRGRVGLRERVWRGVKDMDRWEYKEMKGKGVIEMEWIRRVEEKDHDMKVT